MILGCDERLTSYGKMEYMLVLSLSEIGNLQDYLRENTVSFQIYCRMAISVARGLSHLHTKIQKGDKTKMCICHRDLNSRNILVKSDLSCCLCDFGFAMKVNGSHYEHEGEMVLAETKSIYEVGTVRYMSPEILEGAVNLRDCETTLKQIDVYSLALVLWELCMRCHDFYPPEMVTPPYKAPYEAETGVHPSFDQMRLIVLQHKARPMFPPCWGGGPAAHASQEICEDLWDHDPDARLTSLCVEERLMEIATMKPRSHYVSSGMHLSANNVIMTAPPIVSPLRGQSVPPNHQITENTCDTVLTSPSSDNGRVIPIKNRDFYGQQIHAFQGRNLCLERNLVQIHQSDQSNDDKPIKKCPLAKGNQLITGDNNNDNHFFEMEYEVLVEELLTKNIRDSCSSSTHSQNYVDILPKKINADRKATRWSSVREIIQRKFLRKSQDALHTMTSPTNKNIHLNMIESHEAAVYEVKPNNIQRPRHLDISPIVVNRNPQVFKTPPHDNESFAIIREPSKITTSKSATLNSKSTESSESNMLQRQRSLEVFRDVFGPPKGSVERLRDVHQRIKTPGDVPASVRKVRASKTLSLYDDRMMDSQNFEGSSNSM